MVRWALPQAPSTSERALTLQDMLLCGLLPSTESFLNNKVSKLMGAMQHYAHTQEIIEPINLELGKFPSLSEKFTYALYN